MILRGQGPIESSKHKSLAKINNQYQKKTQPNVVLYPICNKAFFEIQGLVFDKTAIHKIPKQTLTKFKVIISSMT